jgi:phage shock protein E
LPEFEKWVNSSLHPFDFPDDFLIYYLTIFLSNGEGDITMKKLLAAVLVAAVAVGCASKPQFKCCPSRNVTLLEGSVLLDVRTQKEYDERHLDGAILLPHDQVKDRIASVVPDKNKLIYIYCGSGRRADMVRKTLDSLGYRNHHNLCGIKVAEEALRK